MIEYVIITTDTGVPIVTRGYVNRPTNQDLLSGFLSAIDQVTANEMAAEIQIITFENRFITYRKATQPSGAVVRFIVVSEPCLSFPHQEDCICVPTALARVSADFTERYGTDSFGEVVETSRYAGFHATIDAIVEEHFQKHYYLDTYLKEFFHGASPADHDLLGFVVFKHGRFFGYQFPHWRFPGQYQRVASPWFAWREVGLSGTGEPVRQVTEFPEFIACAQEHGPYAIFTCWRPRVTFEKVHNLHARVVEHILAHLKKEEGAT